MFHCPDLAIAFDNGPTFMCCADNAVVLVRDFA